MLYYLFFFLGFYGIRQVGIFTSVSFNVNSADYSTQHKIDNRVFTSRESYDIERVNGEELNPENEACIIEQSENDSKTKYQRSNLTQEKALAVHKELIALIATERVFKDPEISLTQLAKRLNVHPNLLSQVINSIENKNFYDFINELRVEEFKRIVILPVNRKYTLLTLALECGFNSKASFNRNFKKVTNMSPTEYSKTADFEI